MTSSDDTTGPASSGPRRIEAAQGMAENVEVIDNVAESRYEAWVDGERAGVLDYRRRRARISMIHTEVDHRFGGRGIGTRLAGTALDAARAAGLVVLPICPLVAGYIGRHPEYEDLVVGRRRAETSSDPTGRPGGGAPDDLRPGPSTGRGDPPIGAP